MSLAERFRSIQHLCYTTHLTQRLSLIEAHLEKIEDLNHSNQLLKQKVEELEERVNNLPSSIPFGHSGQLSSIPVYQGRTSNDIPVSNSNLPSSIPVSDSNPLASTALAEASLPERISAPHSNPPGSTLVESSHIPTSTPVDQERLRNGTPTRQPISITGETNNLPRSTPVELKRKPNDSLGSVPSNTPFQRDNKSPKKAKKKKEVSPDLPKAAEVTQAPSKRIAKKPHHEVETAPGITNAELARRLGVDKSAVSRWKGGLTKPGNPKVAAEFAQWEFKGGAWYRKD